MSDVVGVIDTSVSAASLIVVFELMKTMCRAEVLAENSEVSDSQSGSSDSPCNTDDLVHLGDPMSPNVVENFGGSGSIIYGAIPRVFTFPDERGSCPR